MKNCRPSIDRSVKKRRAITRALEFVVGAFVASLSTGALAATCIPDIPDGAGLQGCLDSTVPGDTILLRPGVYVPPNPLVFPAPEGRTFFINKALTIRGQTGDDDDGGEVILSGDLGGSRAFNVFVIDTDAAPGPVTLENLTIEGGDTSAGGFFVGGGIVAAPNQTVTLNDVTVRDNAANAGGGIWLGLNGSVWTINDSTFTGNSAADFGGGLAMFSIFGGSTNSLSISKSKFVGNNAGNFGGAVDILLIENSGVSYSIVDSTFENNTAPGRNGGAVSAILNLFPTEEILVGEIIKSSFTNNGSAGGGAIYLDGGKVQLEKNTFTGNLASDSGGALYMDRTLAGYTLVKNEFEANRATQNGGAIYNQAIVNEISKTEFEKNCAGGSGGALYNTTRLGVSNPSIPTTGVIALIHKSDFENNHAGDKGGAIANVTTPGTSAFEMANINEIRKTDIEENTAGVADPGIHDPDLGVLFLNQVELEDNEIGGGCPANDDDDDDD